MTLDALLFSKFIHSNSADCYRKKSYGFYELEENCIGNMAWGNTHYQIYTDNNGFRVKKPHTIQESSKVGRNSILFIGDSFTFGINGEWKNTFVGMVESKLTNETVFNAGVTSYSPTPYVYALTKAYAKGIRPTRIIVAIDISDVQDEAAKWDVVDNQPRAIYEQPVPPESLADALNNIFPRTLLVYHFIRDKVYVNKAEKTKYVWNGELKHILDMPRSAFTHTLAKKLETCGFENLKCGYLPYGVAGGLQRILSRMQLISSMAKANNAKLYLLIYPWPAQLAYESTVIDWEHFIDGVCEQIHCNGVINGFPKFKEFKTENPDWYSKLFIQGDIHYNSFANRMIADEILSFLANHP